MNTFKCVNLKLIWFKKAGLNEKLSCFSYYTTSCFPLPRKHYTNSQSHSRETSACGGCMLLAPPTHNNWEWAVRLVKPSVRKLTKTKKFKWKKGHSTLLICKKSSYPKSDKWQTSIGCKMCRQPLTSAIPSTGTDLTIAAAFSAISPYEKKQTRDKDIISAITDWTATDMMPVSTV